MQKVESGRRIIDSLFSYLGLLLRCYVQILVSCDAAVLATARDGRVRRSTAQMMAIGQAVVVLDQHS